MYHVVTTYTDEKLHMIPELEGTITATGNAPEQVADAADAAIDLYNAAVKQAKTKPDAFAVFCFAGDEPAFYSIINR